MSKLKKQSQIQLMSDRFYDTRFTPSVLLQTEMHKAGITDEVLENAVKELSALQSERYKLTDAYSATMSTELYPLKRIFEYQNQKLSERHATENLEYTKKGIPVPQHIQRKQTTERNNLRADQIARKTKALEPAEKALQACEDKLYFVFMNAVKHLYR